MNNKLIKFKSKNISGTINLPASKSLSNRVLIINALSNSGISVKNLSVCDDTDAMLTALSSIENSFDVGHAGTAMRFLTAYLAQKPGDWIITGSERMQQRPIGILVDALNTLGADIEYIGNSGYPPLHIKGKHLCGGVIEVSASISSQYISALMMIAPLMEQGLRLTLTGQVVSRTYIEMTVGIMRHFGAQLIASDNDIVIMPHPYTPTSYCVESDWSGASYFYELLAIAQNGIIELPNLHQDSLQGDSGQIALWERLGVTSRFTNKGAIIEKGAIIHETLIYDFMMMPDLVQSFVVACCVIGKPFIFSGVETLRIKETDRIYALTTELRKLGYIIQSEGDGKIFWDGSRCTAEEQPIIKTWDDHRMAMAFAPAALVCPNLIIENAEVISKSFPGYWNELKKLGMN